MYDIFVPMHSILTGTVEWISCVFVLLLRCWVCIGRPKAVTCSTGWRQYDGSDVVGDGGVWPPRRPLWYYNLENLCCRIMAHLLSLHSVELYAAEIGIIVSWFWTICELIFIPVWLKNDSTSSYISDFLVTMITIIRVLFS